MAAATTSARGTVQLSTATNSTSTTTAATPSAVKAAYDLAASKANATHTHTAAQVGAATAGLAVYAVGSYIFAVDERGKTNTNPGVAVAGAYLRPAGFGIGTDYSISASTTNYLGVPARLGSYGVGMAGTWRCMGYSTWGSYEAYNYGYAATLWLRIA
ncbi:MAG: tail fiber protein [Halothiobacillus sp.]|nr:tail fiber protein [Halothiobacillus sp.]